MSAADQDTSTPLNPGTPDDPTLQPSLTPSGVGDTSSITPPASPTDQGSSGSTTAGEPGGNEEVTTTPPDTSNGGDSDTSTPTPIPDPSTNTSTRTRTRIQTPLPPRPPPVSSTRPTIPVDTWTTVTRTPTPVPSPPLPTIAEDPPLEGTTIISDQGLGSEPENAPNAGTDEDADAADNGSNLHSEDGSGSQLDPSTDTTVKSLSASRDILPSQQASSPLAPHASTVDKQSTPSTAHDKSQDQEENGMTGGAKAGLALGIIGATVLLFLVFHFWRKYSRAAKRRQYLKEQSNAVFHRRNESGQSWMGTDTDWPSTAGEKSSRKQEDGAPANSPPPSYLPNPPIESAHPVNTWSMWVQRLAPARPPSPTASATASSLAPNDPRISIVAPSPVSSRAALLQASGQHSRTSSALSGNHLHPSYIRDRRIQRPLSAKSRESLATLTNTSGEPSPVLSEITNRFPIPNALEARADKAQNFNGSAGTMASSNPFWSLHSRSGDTGGHASTQQRYSQNTMLSNDGGRNPFEFETETGAFDIDFSRIGVTPAHSGHSTLNPTTPVTPQNRRKSTSSLSLYSEEGHIRSLNPFLTEDNTPRHQKTLLQDQNSNNVVESANIEQRPWSPLEIGSAATSRKPSFVSSRSGPDLAAWEDEMLDPATHTPKTFSKIVDMYAGRAM